MWHSWGIRTVTIEILTLGIAVYTYVGIQTNWFAAPAGKSCISIEKVSKGTGWLTSGE